MEHPLILEAMTIEHLVTAHLAAERGRQEHRRRAAATTDASPIGLIARLRNAGFRWRADRRGSTPVTRIRRQGTAEA